MCAAPAARGIGSKVSLSPALLCRIRARFPAGTSIVLACEARDPGIARSRISFRRIRKVHLNSVRQFRALNSTLTCLSPRRSRNEDVEHRLVRNRQRKKAPVESGEGPWFLKPRHRVQLAGFSQCGLRLLLYRCCAAAHSCAARARPRADVDVFCSKYNGCAQSIQTN